MAGNKKPSIYSDRADIGSAKDLDEYGVWVKSEPQVLSDDEGLSSALDVSTSAKAETDESLTFDDAVFDVDSASSGSGTAEFPDDDIEINLDDDPLTSQHDDLSISDTAAGSEDIEIEDTSFDEFENSSQEETTEFSDDSITNDEFETVGIPTVKSIENNLNNISEEIEDGNVSTHLLKQIASELSSIRNELTDLKKDFPLYVLFRRTAIKTISTMNQFPSPAMK